MKSTDRVADIVGLEQPVKVGLFDKVSAIMISSDEPKLYWTIGSRIGMGYVAPITAEQAADFLKNRVPRVS